MYIPWAKILLALIVTVGVVWAVVWGVLSVLNFYSDISNTLRYGPTRTSVVSAAFGIGNDSQRNPTTVIAINLNGTLVIQVLPAGDVSRMKAYPTGLTLMGEGAAKLPIILTTKDLNQDQKLDVLVEIPGQRISLSLMNNGDGFTLVQ